MVNKSLAATAIIRNADGTLKVESSVDPIMAKACRAEIQRLRNESEFKDFVVARRSIYRDEVMEEHLDQYAAYAAKLRKQKNNWFLCMLDDLVDLVECILSGIGKILMWIGRVITGKKVSIR